MDRQKGDFPLLKKFKNQLYNFMEHALNLTRKVLQSITMRVRWMMITGTNHTRIIPVYQLLVTKCIIYIIRQEQYQISLCPHVQQANASIYTCDRNTHTHTYIH